jgi:hypothetical protein
MSLENTLVTEYMIIAQYDWATSSPVSGLANPLAHLINQTLSAKNHGEVLSLPLIMFNNANATDCIAGPGDPDAPQVPVPTGAVATWWIYCNIFPVSEFAVSPDNSLFPPYLVDEPAFVCAYPAFAGPDSNHTNQQWVDRYQLTDAALDRVTRLLITKGTSDRTAAIGTPRLTLSTDRNHSRVITALGVGHVEQANSEAIEPRGLKTQLDLVGGLCPVTAGGVFDANLPAPYALA